MSRRARTARGWSSARSAASDAENFAGDLETVGIDAFKWTNSEI